MRWTVCVALGLGVLTMAAVGCKSGPQATPLNKLNAQQMRGHEVFQARCAACHHDRDAGTLAGPALLGLFKRQDLPSGAAATDERVLATINRGRGMMPAMGATMDQQQVEDLMAYLHTL
jgi:mono/diheme cytochrome c family protein